MCKELIITCRKSCYRVILRLRHQSLIVHPRSELVPVYSLPCDDIYMQAACEYGELVLGECGTSTKYTSTEYRCVLVVQHRRQTRYVLFPNLTDLLGQGKTVELKQTTKQTNEQTTRKNTLFTLSRLKLHGKKKLRLSAHSMAYL